jgi:hypothetical protein
MRSKRWADLPILQKIGIIIGGTIQIGLLVVGLWDLAHRKPEEVRGDRRFWVGFMFVNWIGPLAYFVYGRKNSPLRFWGCGKEEQGAQPAAVEETAGFAGPSVL